MRKRFTLALALTGTALLAASGAAAASDGAGAAITSSGLAATGWAGPFTVTFVKPSGSTVGATTIQGVNLGKPWGSLFEMSTDSPIAGIGHQVLCDTVVTNPATFSPGYQAANYAGEAGQSPVNPVSGIYFDASCDDGSGYDFYRVRWDDVTDSSGQPWHLFEDNTPAELGAFYWGSSVQDGGAHGTLSVPLDNDGWEAAQITVYGHDARGFHFVADGGGEVVPQGEQITTTAW